MPYIDHAKYMSTGLLCTFLYCFRYSGWHPGTTRAPSTPSSTSQVSACEPPGDPVSGDASPVQCLPAKGSEGVRCALPGCFEEDGL